MGRFGNVMLTGGHTMLELGADAGEVVRFFLTNTANTRIFNIAVPAARMKLVGGDSGRVEREQWIDSVLLAPSERAVVDVLFDEPGTYSIEHHTPDRTYTLGAVEVATPAGRRRSSTTSTPCTPTRSSPRSATGSTSERRTAAGQDAGLHRLDAAALRRRAAGGGGLRVPDASRGHQHRAGHLPEVRHEARPQRRRDRPRMTTTTCITTPVTGWSGKTSCPRSTRRPTRPTCSGSSSTTTTGAENTAIDWAFTVGDRVKLRLVNTMDSDHPMHHPFHVHGAGRFLVLDRDGAPNDNLVWKDTVLVRAGETVDILLELTEPGHVDGALPHRRAQPGRDDVQLPRRGQGGVLTYPRVGAVGSPT